MARMNLFVENQKSSTRQPQHNLKSNQKSPINNNNNNKSKNTTNSTAKSAAATTTTTAAAVVSVPNNKVQSSPIRIFTRSRQQHNPGQTPAHNNTGCPNTQQSINNTTPPRFSTSTGCPVVVLQTSTPIAVPRKQHRQIQNFFGNSNDDSSSSNSDNDDSLLNNSYYMPPGYPVICGGGVGAAEKQNTSLNSSNSSSGVSSLSSSPSGSTQSSLDGSTLSASSRYAGCKWTEPPSPLTLPQPPQHWTKSPLLTSAEQSHSAPVAMVMNRQQHPQQQQQLSKASTVKKAVKPVKSCCEQQQQLFDVTRQLKMLLKVQA